MRMRMRILRRRFGRVCRKGEVEVEVEGEDEG
jgi:hypothetical protein